MIHAASTAIILGSSRGMGNTYQVALTVSNKISAPIFNLSDYDIGPFDYEYKNKNDDFFTLIKKILSFKRIILASPVYWYAPSSVMKVFLDRLTDLLVMEKELGRQLRLKTGAVIATGGDQIPASCFEKIFQLSYQYLGISYKGMLYCACSKDVKLNQHMSAIDHFIEELCS